MAQATVNVMPADSSNPCRMLYCFRHIKELLLVIYIRGTAALSKQTCEDHRCARLINLMSNYRHIMNVLGWLMPGHPPFSHYHYHASYSSIYHYLPVQVIAVVLRSLLVYQEWFSKNSFRYCRLQKSWRGAFVHHPVFQSSHRENWV